MEYKNEEGTIYLYKKNIIKQAIGNLNKLNLLNFEITKNLIIEIPITYQIFDLDAQQYITDESINKTVDVYVNGELATTEPIVNGEGTIQFESAESGAFVIKVENATCEVIVHEN